MARRPLRPARTAQFKRDFKLVVRRGWDVNHLLAVMDDLIARRRLGAEYKVHPLRGEYKDHLECHIGGDFLLIWHESGTEITFVRTGNHSDLFGK
jgi:mRNA interferase YafQ